MAKLRIATFNINGIRSRLPALLQWLEREAPDVVCLQELKAVDSAFPVDALRDAGYGAIWQGQSAWNGVAILSKGDAPIESRRGLPGFEADTHSRYLEAAVGGVLIACLYLPNGNPQPGPKFDYKLAWFDHFIAHAAKLFKSGHPVVLAGDFNVVPTDEDIYNPRSWLKDALLQPETRERYRKLLAQGWTDALRAHFGDERVYTFWDYFRRHWDTNSGLRIDHLLLSADLAPRLRDAGVDRWVRGEAHASDHAPTWVELDMGVKKSAATKSAATKSAATKSTATKSTATKSAATKSAATKSAATKSAATKSAATKSAATKSAATKSAATKSAATKRAATKRAATQSPATKSPATKSPATKSAEKSVKPPTRKSAPRKKSTSGDR